MECDNRTRSGVGYSQGEERLVGSPCPGKPGDGSQSDGTVKYEGASLAIAIGREGARFAQSTSSTAQLPNNGLTSISWFVAFQEHGIGIYRLEGANAVFVDSVRLINDFYTRFKVSPAAYYSRFIKLEERTNPNVCTGSRKKKRKRSDCELNARELCAEKRHQEARPFLLKAYEAFLEHKNLLSFVFKPRNDGCYSARTENMSQLREESEISFVDLGGVWQAPLYEMSLRFWKKDKLAKDDDLWFSECGEEMKVPIFNNLVFNDTVDDAEGEFLGKVYVIPRMSSFHMSDMTRIHDLVPDQSDHGFNFIVIDPPWENGSARQKRMYPTLPNRYFLSLPVKQLSHPEGALLALWVTNKEKLRVFVENELFPAWGITNVSCFYWLKVKPDGSLVSELDLFHHRPYECLLVGYCCRKGKADNLTIDKLLPDYEVIISIPGDYSRKPPIGKLLLDYVPGPKPARCIELFAREVAAGWTSWGNEPLRFQELKYFTNSKE
ncbi:methyltransferase-like protein 2 [Aristolochia californica]|uniref:methyltransferase-like protein 2 n=1 Tax=Aristolochia californica TaxID=171875 RepID=UPI0035D810DB